MHKIVIKTFLTDILIKCLNMKYVTCNICITSIVWFESIQDDENLMLLLLSLNVCLGLIHQSFSHHLISGGASLL